MGCQVIADRQTELQKTGVDPHGLKVGLLPASVKAALDAQRDQRRTRRTSEDDDE